MPLHLNSMTNDAENSNIVAWLLQEQFQSAKVGFASEDKKHIHLFNYLKDEISGDNIGRIVYTVGVNEEEKALEMLDLDIVFDNIASVELRFLEKKPESSDSNEYYDVEVEDEAGHLQIETVNRYMNNRDDLEDTVQQVHICAFPFQLSVYGSMDALNKALGFANPIKVGETDLMVQGYSERFVAPGDAMGGGNEIYSFLIGEIKSYKDVRIKMGEEDLTFVLAQVDTGVGTIPVPMGREVFDLSELKEGSYVGMNADVKADFAKITGPDYLYKK